MAGALYSIYQRIYPRYDVIFGQGVDFSTGRFIMQPNPAGSIIVYYTPTGADSGPTNQTINLIINNVVTPTVFVTWTQTTLAKCQAKLRTSAPYYGDWILFRDYVDFPSEWRDFLPRSL